MEAGTGRKHGEKQCDKKWLNAIKRQKKGGGLGALERVSFLIFLDSPKINSISLGLGIYGR